MSTIFAVQPTKTGCFLQVICITNYGCTVFLYRWSEINYRCTVFLQAFLYRWSVQPIKMHISLASILKEWVITESTFLLVSNHRVCLLLSEATTLFSFVLALPWSKEGVWVERSIIPQRCLFLKTHLMTERDRPLPSVVNTHCPHTPPLLASHWCRHTEAMGQGHYSLERRTEVLHLWSFLPLSSLPRPFMFEQSSSISATY